MVFLTLGSSLARGQERIYQGLSYYYSRGFEILQPEFFYQLRRSISSPRIEGYRQKNSDTDLDLFARYLWNVSLSEALYPTLHILEVALRNEVYQSVSRTFHPHWLYQVSPVILQPEEQDFVDSIIQQRFQRPGKRLVDESQLIAELTLGFWVRLFNARYEMLWRKLLKDKTTFPALPRHLRKRKTLSTRLNRIRDLRNRIFHHEPIWHWMDLGQKHGELLEAIYWINPSLRLSVDIIDNFPKVFQRGPAFYHERLAYFAEDFGYF